MDKNETRATIIRIGTDLISRQGFNATGIDAVLKEAGVPKGSFYHYFRSKEEFGLAVIDHFAERYDQRLDTFLNDDEVTPLNRVRNYLESGLARLEQNRCSKGCLIGNLGQELADQHERFRVRLDGISVPGRSVSPSACGRPSGQGSWPRSSMPGWRRGSSSRAWRGRSCGPR